MYGQPAMQPHKYLCVWIRSHVLLFPAPTPVHWKLNVRIHSNIKPAFGFGCAVPMRFCFSGAVPVIRPGIIIIISANKNELPAAAMPTYRFWVYAYAYTMPTYRFWAASITAATQPDR